MIIADDLGWNDLWGKTYERMVRIKTIMYIQNKRTLLESPLPSVVLKGPSYFDLIGLSDAKGHPEAQSDIFETPRPPEESYYCTIDYFQILNVSSMPRYVNELNHMRSVLAKWQIDTQDTSPDSLTPGWYNQETGELLNQIEHTLEEYSNGR